MSEEKELTKEAIEKRIAKDKSTVEGYEDNQLVEVTIEKNNFRGSPLNRTIRENIKTKKGGGKIKVTTEQWIVGESITQSKSQVLGWLNHGLVSTPKKSRKEKR